MKKWLSLFASEMIRPMLYQAFRRGVIALTAVLLWKQYVSKNAPNGLTNGLFTAGMIFLVLAWTTFLKMDGLQFRFVLGERRTSEKKRHFSRDMVDFVDEHITTLDELDDEERLLCTLLSSLILMVLFFLATFILSFF